MPANRIRILNVDDNEVQRYATTRTLTSAGFEVIEAGTAKEALSLVSSDVSLIVVDVDLPDIDGFQLTRTLKGEPATADIPIIQVSAVFSGYSHVRDGLRNGADAYFTFPLDPTSLISTVRKLAKSRLPA
jgi:sigma-B regulation protein RsbU (phosphoserine phosphatase)